RPLRSRGGRPRGRGGRGPHDRPVAARGVRFMTPRLGRPAGLLVLALACGCSAPIVSLQPPAQAPTAKAYDRIPEPFTRLGRAISRDELDTVLLVQATLRAEEFEQA